MNKKTSPSRRVRSYSFPSQYTLVQSNIITFSHSTQAWTFPFFCEAWGTHCRFEHTHIQQVLFKKTQRAPASYPAREKLLQVKKGEDALPPHSKVFRLLQEMGSCIKTLPEGFGQMVKHRPRRCISRIRFGRDAFKPQVVPRDVLEVT